MHDFVSKPKTIIIIVNSNNNKVNKRRRTQQTDRQTVENYEVIFGSISFGWQK